MKETEVNIMQNVEPTLVYKVTNTTSLPFDVETELEKYSRIFITKEFDMFRIVHLYEAAMRDYKIFGETKDGDKKLLFTCNHHFECCVCCEQFVIGCIFCGYVCCNSIMYQMDYKRNEMPFYT